MGPIIFISNGTDYDQKHGQPWAGWGQRWRAWPGGARTTLAVAAAPRSSTLSPSLLRMPSCASLPRLPLSSCPFFTYPRTEETRRMNSKRPALLLALLAAHGASGFGVTGNRPRGLLQPANVRAHSAAPGRRTACSCAPSQRAPLTPRPCPRRGPARLRPRTAPGAIFEGWQARRGPPA